MASYVNGNKKMKTKQKKKKKNERKRKESVERAAIADAIIYWYYLQLFSLQFSLVNKCDSFTFATRHSAKYTLQFDEAKVEKKNCCIAAHIFFSSSETVLFTILFVNFLSQCTINVQCALLCVHTWIRIQRNTNRARILRNGNHNFHSVFNELLCTVTRAILCENFFSLFRSIADSNFMPFHELFSIIDHIYDWNDCERECQVTWFFTKLRQSIESFLFLLFYALDATT